MGVTYNPRIVTDGLRVSYDAGNIKSYPGTGNTWSSLIGSKTFSIFGPTYSTLNNGYFSFDGSNDYMDNLSSYSISNSFTWDIWVKPAVSTSAGTVISRGGYPSIAFNSTTFYFVTSFATVAKFLFPVNFTTVANKWYNITVTANYFAGSTYILLYINGIYNAQIINAGTQDSLISSLTIGALTPVLVPFNGIISNIKEYNRALNSLEVSQNFNALRGRYSI